MWKNTPYKGCIYFSITLNLISIALILILKGFLPPVMPLFYGLPIGSDQLIPNPGIVLIPIIGIIITAINVFISGLVNDVFLKKVLIVSCAFVSFLLAITATKIILLVGFF